MNKILVASALLFAYNAGAQDVDKKILNWYNGAKYGMSTDKAYAKLLADKKPAEKVVVAVIDSGVDIEHEDLQGSIWVNKDEIPGNGIDDDNNGYIDDVNGWSFLGNPDGENINHEQLEVTRLYKKYHEKYAGKSDSDIPASDKAEFEKYKVYRDEVEGTVKQRTAQIKQYEGILEKYQSADAELVKHFGGAYSKKDLKKALKDPKVGESANLIYPLAKSGASVEDVKEQLQGAFDYFNGQLNYHYNVDLDARSVVGDDPSDFSDVNYGNNIVEGPDAFHGTHVAGIIAATRNNGIGNDGVADNVLIMSVRAIPDGDERDKDVALAIRYAVDNGAQIINGSFGKAFSPYQEEVIKAIRYAEEKGVLICHAAGNSSKDIGKESNFPSPKYPSMNEEFKNWIEVGASTRYKKAKLSKEGGLKQQGLAATFSNYDEEMVDVFAPGLEIYATTPNNEYAAIQGTSMASPMVAGLAALLKSYFPELTMFEIRDIIFESVQKIDLTTPLPGTSDNEVPFKTLSSTGGIVNTYNAVELAIEKTAK
ncbi:S8 family peptidase [Crocinitomix algicola]|uniref:S8 family peptidase n=1 Tax=Crocinitomix algicola TaxID=1740263 RepID=UPI000834B302|nr:S8 family peptidase [Crocinitomix algicola]